ncbi:MAG: C-type lectin domain-containing protein [Deltaproteobacteria bacterium]|nr:C-type lectin domain-containing protein [Deltaproteobacteria bacterium]
MLGVVLALALASGALAGCLRQTQFACDGDAACNGGHCEATGFCSFDDATCAGGRRYGELSGALANACVDVPPEPDAPPPSRCPDSYAPIGGSAHVYRLRATVTDWVAHRDTCAGEGGFLAIPDDQAELDLLADLAAGNDLWVGVHETGAVDVYETVLGAPATFLPWDTGQPDGAGPADCVRLSAQSRRYRDDRCNLNRRAICECVP